MQMRLSVIKNKTHWRQLTLKVNSIFISKRFQNAITKELKLSVFKGGVNRAKILLMHKGHTRHHIQHATYVDRND